MKKELIKELLRNKKKFQEWAIKTYIKNYYSSKDISFVKICRPSNIHPDVKGIPLLNFDVEYYSSFPKEKWKINFLIANTCVRKVLNRLLISKNHK